MCLRVHDSLDDAEQVKGAARQPVDARHRDYVAGGQLAEHPAKLAPVDPRARHLLAVDVSAAASDSKNDAAMFTVPMGPSPGEFWAREAAEYSAALALGSFATPRQVWRS